MYLIKHELTCPQGSSSGHSRKIKGLDRESAWLRLKDESSSQLIITGIALLPVKGDVSPLYCYIS